MAEGAAQGGALEGRKGCRFGEGAMETEEIGLHVLPGGWVVIRWFGMKEEMISADIAPEKKVCGNRARKREEMQEKQRCIVGKNIGISGRNPWFPRNASKSGAMSIGLLAGDC